eukprot:scaffold116441_cov27-Phaeocystis_antarctica.AAC.1
MPLPQQPLAFVESSVRIRALALPASGALRRRVAARVAARVAVRVAARVACRVAVCLAAAAARRRRRVAHEPQALHVQRLRGVAHL